MKGLDQSQPVRACYYTCKQETYYGGNAKFVEKKKDSDGKPIKDLALHWLPPKPALYPDEET